MYDKIYMYDMKLLRFQATHASSIKQELKYETWYLKG